MRKNSGYKWKKISPYLVIIILNFYLLSLVIKDTGTAMIILLAVIPLICFVNLKLFKKVSQKFGSFVIPTVVVVKGEQGSHHPKGGENMKPNNHEQSK